MVQEPQALQDQQGTQDLRVRLDRKVPRVYRGLWERQGSREPRVQLGRQAVWVLRELRGLVEALDCQDCRAM